MTALAHPCPVCSAPAGEPCSIPYMPLCAHGVHVERLYPRACPECGAVPGQPCAGGHTHARRDPSPVDAIRAILLRGLALARGEEPAPAWREVAELL